MRNKGRETNSTNCPAGLLGDFAGWGGATPAERQAKAPNRPRASCSVSGTSLLRYCTSARTQKNSIPCAII